MDYSEWGMEYLSQAQRLKEHIAPLKKQLARLSGEDQVLMYRRISMLSEMRLECLRTGRELVERGEQYETETRPQP
jgi:hypothetical protein